MTSPTQRLLAPMWWTVEAAHEALSSPGAALSVRTTERLLTQLGFLVEFLAEVHGHTDELGRPVNELVARWALNEAQRRRQRVLQLQTTRLPATETLLLHARDGRGKQFWHPVPANIDSTGIAHLLAQLASHLGKEITVFAHGDLVQQLRHWPGNAQVHHTPQMFAPILDVAAQQHARTRQPLTPHLQRLEAQSIFILREALANAENPVMTYSIGKDSGVMAHLARKAFYPALPPFPLLHIDTRWKFQEMYLFRDFMARESGFRLIVHTNPEAVEKNINPFDHGSALHTDITKTVALKQALDQHRFDVVFGGARRDEEKSRAKERVFSFRTRTHQWDPKNQRPELWNLYNTHKQPGESLRVFPLSNWTELDIWHYTLLENLPVVPLYFAKVRPVVVRPEMIMMVDDSRCRLLPGEQIELRKVRFRTLGCYPLSGAVESNAETLEDILAELVNARQSERQGRKIDTDSSGSMERKKLEGYF